MGPDSATAPCEPRGDADEVAARLRSAGLSPTRRRRQVLEAIEHRQRPVGAHELYVELARRGHGVGMSTVYRALSALAEAGLLHAFAGDGETRYRLCTAGRHYHLVCRRCGTVREYPADDDGAWLDRIAAEADFEPDPRKAEVQGVCGSCLRADRNGTDG
ncbi:Fur family transcriptional regulator [Actinoallomurus acaciae]|uniref:Fur family transcriptional regulator n=1 Tax=Actinoallomurus acaciae TaxID=502577 RepID=A0ABV5YD19_9ACTN